MRSEAESIHQQIEVSIAIDISEHHAGAIPSCASDLGCRDFLEAKPADISIQHVTVIKRAEVKVDQPVCIHVSRRDAGAAEEIAVGRGPFISEEICECDSGLIWGN